MYRADFRVKMTREDVTFKQQFVLEENVLFGHMLHHRTLKVLLIMYWSRAPIENTFYVYNNTTNLNKVIIIESYYTWPHCKR